MCFLDWPALRPNHPHGSPQCFAYRADNVVLQLEDPFGYDKADIKVDAIVEDLRVCPPFHCYLWHSGSRGHSPPPLCLSIFTVQSTKPIFLTTGGDERIDRRVEKRLGHVHRLESPNARRCDHGDTEAQIASGE